MADNGHRAGPNRLRRISTRHLIGLLLLFTLVTAAAATVVPAADRGAAGVVTAAADSRPNIVFISADDMRVEDLSAMPNVRRLIANQGTTFSTSYAPFPLCCPGRAAWITGQYNHNNNVMGNDTLKAPTGGYAALDNTNTVATWLRSAGYQTAMVGKFLNGYGKVKPIAVPPGWQEWHAELAGGDYFNNTLRENTGGELRTRTYTGVYQVDLYDSIATDIIDRRVPSAAPLFLWVSQYAPHGGTPVESDDPALATPAVPPRWRNFYAGEPTLKDPSFNEANVSDKPTYVRSAPPLTTDVQAQLKEVNAQRLESLRAVDQSVAHIVEALRAAGELANTVLVFSSDNGHMMGEHRRPWGKVVPYEASARVPLIIRGPGFPAGITRQPWVANIDLAPTFADLANTNPGLDVDGRSLLPLATSPSTWASRTMVMESGPSTLGGDDEPTTDWYHGVRTNRYKYIRYNTGEVEFYDLLADPDEMTSLTNDPAHDATQAQLALLLTRMENCAGATCR